MANNKPLKIYVVEDDEWHCNFFEYNSKLNEDNHISKFYISKDFLKALTQETPNAVTLDYSLPDMHDYEFIKYSRASGFFRNISLI